MWNRIKSSLYRFMSGRYGVDALSRFLLWVYLFLILLSVFVHSTILSILCTACAIYLLFRMLSRNTLARSKENQAFLRSKQKITGWFTLKRDQFRDRKTHIYRSCPSCHAMLRLPKQPGTHTVKCPQCQNRFEVKVK